MVHKYQSHPPFNAEIDTPLYVNDRAYIPESPMKDGRRSLWYRSSLIPYTLDGSVHAFMGPLPRHIKKP